MIWFTSDTHYNHARILELGAGRPFDSIEEHNEILVENWNAVVGVDDTVYHLGDVALGPWPVGLEYIGRCNGYKILVPGNHDRVSSLDKRRERFLPDYEQFFEIVKEIETFYVIRDGTSWEFVISHYPYNANGHDMSGNADRFENLRPVDEGKIILHGHTHQSEVLTLSNLGTPQIHVGVDSWNWTPVNLNDIMALLEDDAGWASRSLLMIWVRKGFGSTPASSAWSTL